MTDQRSMLCVGGPKGGKRVAVLYGERFRVPIRRPLSFNLPEDPPQLVSVEFVEYKMDAIHTPQGNVYFWVPVGQTPLDTLTLLLESYEQRNSEI